jgi:hypothetical protein
MVAGATAAVLLPIPFLVVLAAWETSPLFTAGAAEALDLSGAGAFPSKKPAGTASIFWSTASFGSDTTFTGFISAGGADVAVRAALRALICEDVSISKE